MTDDFPIVVCLGTQRLWTGGRSLLVHAEGRVGSRGFERFPTGKERTELFDAIARSKEFLRNELRLLEMAERVLTRGEV